MVGISSYGGYVPRYRLNRFVVFGAMGWLAPALLMNAKGEKAVANYDEDALTMAVSAGINCLNGFDRSILDAVYFASTTAPYKERQNANIVAGALCAREDIRSADFSGSLKAGTGALLSALEFVTANGGSAAVCAGDNRLGKMGSVQEMYFGDAGAAMLVSDTDVIAEYKGSYSLSYDFVDHLRGADAKYDRQWEERWIRDVGYGEFIPQVINGLCAKYGLAAGDFAKVVYPCYYGGARKSINKQLGFEPDRVVNDLSDTVGDSGAAHPLLMLSQALEEASPGRQDPPAGLRQRLRCPLLRSDRSHQRAEAAQPLLQVAGQPQGPGQLHQVPGVAGHRSGRAGPAGRRRPPYPLDTGMAQS